MKSHVEIADANHRSGYNCAQSVVRAFADDLGYNADEASKLAEGFGSGFGCREGICGALVGACMAISYGSSEHSGLSHVLRKSTYERTGEAFHRFESRAGSVICRDIKGASTGVVMMSCADCIRTAAAIAEELIG